MIKKVLIILFLSLLSSCTVDSPISATQTFFKLIQAKNYQGACTSMINTKSQSLDETQQKACEVYFQTNYKELNSFTIENALPLPQETLKSLGIDQGFDVYYSATLNPEVKHEKAVVVKVSGKHVVVWEK